MATSSTMNDTNLCRLCAAKDEFTKDLLDENNKLVLNLIQELIKIKIYDSDTMSTKICLNCEEKLYSFHLFILECKRVQENMKNLCMAVTSEGVLKIKEENTLPISVIKSEVKDEYLAEDLPGTEQDDTYGDFDGNNTDDSLLEDFSIASLQKLKKNSEKTIAEGETVKVADLLKFNNLKLTTFVRMNCNHCDEEFRSWNKLSSHCAKYHKCKPVVHCICGLEMKSQSVIYKHVAEHKVKSKNDKRNKTRNTKYFNIKDSNLVNFDCNICQKKCCSYYSLKTHCENTHNSSPVIQCKCGALLKSKTVLYKHIAEHKNPNVFSCDKCPRIAKSLSAIEKHKLRHVPKEDRLFKCSSCDRVFHTKEALKSHTRSHIPIDERKQYECEICCMKFTTRSSAASHKKVVHDKIKAYVCDLCGYACGTNGELRQHRAIHSDDKPFVCSKCSKPFKTYSNLKTHMDTHEETSYMCYVCSRVLNSRRTLKKHLLVHENDCRHICSYCNKAFKRRQTLKVHLSTHTGDKPLSCKWCDERFAYASTLRSHRLRYHPDKMIGGHAPNPYTQNYANATHHDGNEENLKSDGNVSYIGNVGVSKFESDETIISR